MKIHVVWPLGSDVFDFSLSDKVSAIIEVIASRFGLDKAHVELYHDEKYTKKLDPTLSVLNNRIKRGAKFYLKYTAKLPDREICRMTTPINSADKFLDKGEKMTSEMKNLQKTWGPRAVNLSFFEHRNMKKPIVEDQPESSCYAFRVGKEAISRFQAIAFQENFKTHRICFLFGRINEITGKVTAHCSSEPEQVNAPDHVEVFPEFDIDTLCAVADAFGMKCVGMAISHPADEKFPMTQYMIQLASFYQNYFGEYFTTLVVMPMPGDENNVVIEAFQVKDAAMKMDEEQYFVPSDNPHEVKFKEDLVVYNMKRNSCDVNLLLCAVRVRQTHSKFYSHTFPSPSQYPTFTDLKIYLHDKEYFPSWVQLFDFNLLVFLVLNAVISINEVAQIVCAILEKSDVPITIMDKIHKSTRTS